MKNNKYLLAVSGGVDSCVLFDILLKNNYNFMVVHFNHNTRSFENLIEENLVTGMCELNNIDYEVYHYKHVEGNFQDTARNFRLKTYKELISKYMLKGVILAHHLDDNYENLLMFDKITNNMMQTISYNNGLKIYRPLLFTTKSEIYDYANDNGIVFNEDISNKNTKYLRNFHRVKALDTKKEVKLQKVSELMRLERSYKRIKVSDILTKDEFNSSSEQIVLLFKFIKHNIGDKKIKKRFILSTIKNLDFEGEKEFHIYKNGDYEIVLQQSYNTIKIVKKCFLINEYTKSQLGVIGENTFNGIKFINEVENVVIRTRKPGDKLVINGCSKKVNRFMIDKKISKELRDIYPIVTTISDTVLYIPIIIKK